MPTQKTFKSPPPQRDLIPSLEPGDHLDQKTFHARYEAIPENVRAELIGGVVSCSRAWPRRSMADSSKNWRSANAPSR